ncbi:hypothetical protein KQX54_016481 [Cotesia glomerata]|uniref:Uncharacterized protein n=1 Tax=Cotesia glomerata TaxID=32391 RepID=A0AAV7HYP5_COTGL|nr:hypothetical protein KQX54_016481 [Cotesia glomerata]
MSPLSGPSTPRQLSGISRRLNSLVLVPPAFSISTQSIPISYKISVGEPVTEIGGLWRERDESNVPERELESKRKTELMNEDRNTEFE